MPSGQNSFTYVKRKEKTNDRFRHRIIIIKPDELSKPEQILVYSDYRPGKTTFAASALSSNPPRLCCISTSKAATGVTVMSRLRTSTSFALRTRRSRRA